MIVPDPNAAVAGTPITVSVTGVTTGATYLQQGAIAGSGIASPLVFDFSTAADPGGIKVTWTVLNSSAGSGNTFRVIGLNRSQLVRPVHGNLAESPNLNASGTATNGAAVTVLPISRGNQYRIWNMVISVFNGAASSQAAFLDFGAVRVIPILLGAGQSATIPITFEGGYPLQGLLNITVEAPGTGTIIATVFYSIDC
jgi:hypothetical protein